MPIVDARHYRTLVVCPNKTIAPELTPMLAHVPPLAPIHSGQEYPTRRPLVDLLKKIDPRICFVDFSTDGERALGFMTELPATNSEIPVIALLMANQPDLILKCLRAGATDFLIRP